ncbi:5-formyltetrahydrofolate cyclo-ligase [Leeia sp. TBRC 13508]|uniref:5-formyltetrahydrofolate cyclo-ligase n=1 Tax=Leeia speluncae TaxID=2884804 RepID=A0ABS8D3K2_9NEIS|nr:5-formyltetrahydrofolate cyclo-ligase [Leeia speluncae]MCB6182755.1 5-formyltetrahydrofolate cyclo-ligase [Leeia speluncae]
MSQDKQAIRRSIRRLRKTITPLVRKQAAKAALKFCRKYIPLLKAKRIAFYWPMADEFDVLPMLTFWEEQGKACYLPVVPKNGRRLWFVRKDSRTRWKNNRFGIPEPIHPERIRAEQLDVVLVPLMGIDQYGFRLGMGGGFYDTSIACRRLRNMTRPKLIGVAYELQKVNHLEADPWDIRMDALVSEKEFSVFPKN